MRRNAIIVASTVEVLCPHCGGAQPSPGNGSYLWTVDELIHAQVRRDCVECDEPISVMSMSTARLEVPR